MRTAGLGARCLVGFDLVEISRFEQALARHPRLLERVFTAAEIAYCCSRARPARHLAARFCAKEAVGKLLGRGVATWREIEIVQAQAGSGELQVRNGYGLRSPRQNMGAQPRVVLYGETLEESRRVGIGHIAVSLSHTDYFAGACAVAFTDDTRTSRGEERE